MDEEQVTKDILDAKAQLEVPDTYATSLTNPLSYFRFRIVPNLELNGFDRSLGSLQI
ncbi:unnamed protein product, partial [Rotaria magnacalcarata]